jgi:hypothetical protein
MSVHSLGPRLVAQPPERICSKLVLLVPGVCNQPHLILSRRARSVRGLPGVSGLHQHPESISNFRISSSAGNLFFTLSFVDFTALCGKPGSRLRASITLRISGSIVPRNAAARSGGIAAEHGSSPADPPELEIRHNSSTSGLSDATVFASDKNRLRGLSIITSLWFRARLIRVLRTGRSSQPGAESSRAAFPSSRSKSPANVR